MTAEEPMVPHWCLTVRSSIDSADLASHHLRRQISGAMLRRANGVARPELVKAPV
jgi:hypothetical protein